MYFDNAPSRARRVVRNGDTIVSTVRTYLRAIAPIELEGRNLIVSTGFAVVRPRSVYPNFLSYAIREKRFVDSVMARSVGVSYPAVNASEVGTISIPLPEITEQKAIADFLDAKTATLDALITKKRALIERLKARRTALISRAVTRGLPPEAARAAGFDPQPKMKDSGIEWLGEIPEHWRISRANAMFRFVSGGTPSTDAKAYWGGDIPWVSPKDMKAFEISDTEDHVTELGEKESSTTCVPQNTLLLVVRSGILRHSLPVAITARRMAINQDIKAFIPLSNEIFVKYLGRFVEGQQAQLLVDWRKEGATVESLELELIKVFKFLIPPLDEQQAIATYLDRETAKLDNLAAKVEQAIQRLQDYRTALITAAVTGKIDVRTIEDNQNAC